MKKSHILMNKIKKRHVLPQTEKVSEVLKNYGEYEVDYDWQEEKSRRLNIQKWRRFKHQASS